LAYDGEEGLRLARHVGYDLLLLDVLLPNRDGFSVCRSLRESDETTPVLMVSVRDSPDDKILGLDSGADDYLTKPFSFPELFARIRTLLRRSTDGRNSRLKVADLELDPISHKVWRGGHRLSLSNKEYAVLEYLMRNVGRVLSRSTIVENVWEYQHDTTTNIVDAQIRALRFKIDSNTSIQLIKTVRRVGYVLEVPPADAEP
jgi:DNA-binding response OmpR family regulator